MRDTHLRSADFLDVERHPEITFRSTGAEGTPEAFTLTGELTIMGRTHPVAIRGAVDDDRVCGGAAVVQTQWGIKPYSALLGALKLADEVNVEFDLTLATVD
jgi:polyisoprenoid-binding protein YceI